MHKNIKYPRTKHLPWSLGINNDDLVLASIEAFKNLKVVITEKLDGENTTLYCDYMHARSLEPCIHTSQNWIKGFHSGVRHFIPSGWRVCGENLYAQHSIVYHNLDSYFYIFSVWDDTNKCLGWDETCKWAQKLNAATPRVFYRGIWDEHIVRTIAVDAEVCEGYVVRPLEGFSFDQFNQFVAKFVRKEHVAQDEKHWMYKKVISNQLKRP